MGRPLLQNCNLRLKLWGLYGESTQHKHVVCLFVCWFVCLSVGWLVGRWVGWLVCLFVCWLVGLFVFSLSWNWNLCSFMPTSCTEWTLPVPVQYGHDLWDVCLSVISPQVIQVSARLLLVWCMINRQHDVLCLSVCYLLRWICGWCEVWQQVAWFSVCMIWNSLL